MTHRPLKVLQVVPALASGGVERGTIEVAEALIARGHEPIIISGGGRLVRKLEQIGAEHLEWPIGAKSPFTLRHVRPLRRLLVDRGIDILHARSRVPAWVCLLAWRKLPPTTRPRFVTTVHGLYSVSRYSAVMTRGERVVAVSQTVRDYIDRHYPQTPGDRIVVIPRGVDPAEFSAESPDQKWQDQFFADLPAAKDRPLVTLPGRLTRLKGHHDLLDVFTRLRDAGVDAAALVVGGEDPKRLRYAAELRDRVRTLGLEDRVVFTGHRDDIRAIYAISNVILSLSNKPESFGRTVLEPLTMRRPVIGYDHGGVGEILADVYPAGLVPPRDLDALTDRIRQFLTDGAPPVPAEHPYTLERMLNSIINLYETLAAAPCDT